MNNDKLVKAYIIDDNTDAIALLQQMLESKYSVKVAGTQTCAQKAIGEVINLEPDIIFVDVELPDMSGLDFCTCIRKDVKPETKVVFYTGHDKYMLEAIRREAFDYLLKPATEQELSQIMTRYYENKLAGIPQIKLREEGHLPIILVVNAMNEHLTLRADDCAYFRYNNGDRQWEVVCASGKCYALRHRTTADVILNYTPDFVQIHKRYIVNVNHIKMIQDNQCTLNNPLHGTDELKVSKNYRRQLMDTFYAM